MLDKKQSLKNAHERAKRRIQNYAKLSPDDIINLAHDEYIENGVQRLKANLEEILNRQDKIELNELTLLGMDRVNAYISLLFLTVDSDYDLMQDEFYGDLYVVKYEKPQEVEEDNIFDSVDNVKSVLELGTAIGYSAILMANATSTAERLPRPKFRPTDWRRQLGDFRTMVQSTRNFGEP